MKNLMAYENLIHKHYTNLIFEIDLLTESILADSLNKEQIDLINLDRKNILDKINLVKESNLKNLKENVSRIDKADLERFENFFNKEKEDKEKISDEKIDDNESNCDEKNDKEDTDDEEESSDVSDDVSIDYDELFPFLFKNGYVFKYQFYYGNRVKNTLFIYWHRYLDSTFLSSIGEILNNGFVIGSMAVRSSKRLHDLMDGSLFYDGLEICRSENDLEKSKFRLNFADYSSENFRNKITYLTFKPYEYLYLERPLNDIAKYVRDLNLNLDGIIFENINFKCIESYSFKGLKNLKEIIFKNCAFYEIQYNAFDGLDKLNSFTFERCKMGNIHRNFLNGLKNLINLNLDSISGTPHIRSKNFFNSNKVSNKFESDYKNDFRKYRLKKQSSDDSDEDLYFKYRRVYHDNENNFRSNEIDSYEDLDFNDLSNLIIISLIENNIPSIKKNIFTANHNLEQIFLNNNEIEEIVDYAFDGLKNLKKLFLQENKIKKITKYTFKGLENLFYLDLSRNPLEFVHEEAFIDSKDIEIIRD